jgi:hypothetical protein
MYRLREVLCLLPCGCDDFLGPKRRIIPANAGEEIAAAPQIT